MDNSQLLSICIPIYNRKEFLRRMLDRFLEDKYLFENDIHLFISDNCSQDDLEGCCKEYVSRGLKLEYHRNKENIGPDRNFELCFRSGKGKYIWLLGSDDIPVRGYLPKLITQLKSNDYGLFHISIKPRSNSIIEYTDGNEMAVAVNYWITFMSSNIIRTNSLKGIDFTAFRSSNMLQVPAYLNACLSSQVNAIYYMGMPFEMETDIANNGGYNFVKVFVSNLFGIYESFISNGLLSRKSFNRIKKVEYRDFLLPYIVVLLILKRNKNFDKGNSWAILWKYYGRCFYSYYYFLDYIVRTIYKKINVF